MPKHLSPRRSKEFAIIVAILGAIFLAMRFAGPNVQAWVMSLPPSQQKLPFVVIVTVCLFGAFFAALRYGKD